MYVQLKHYWSGNKPGDCVEAPEELAQRWLAEGSAVEAEQPAKAFVDPEAEEAKKPARKKRQARAKSE